MIDKKTVKSINKWIDVKKTIDFLQRLQNDYDTFPAHIPDPILSMYSLGILYELNGKVKNKKTYLWVKSLQTGHLGFGETTGQGPWDVKTFIGSEMHKFLKILPKYKKPFVKFVQEHQNPDGGFGAGIESSSLLLEVNPAYKVPSLSSLYWPLSLVNVGEKPKNKEKLGKFLNGFLDRPALLDPYTLFMIIRLLNELKLPIENKNEIYDIVSDRIDSVNENSFNIEYFFNNLYVLKSVNKNVENKNEYIKWIIKCQSENSLFKNNAFGNPNISSTFFAIKSLKMLDSKIPNFERILNRIYSYEIKDGGFFNPRTFEVYGTYCAIRALKILGSKFKNKEELISFLISLQRPDGGFGDERATYWIVGSLEVLDSLNFINKNLLINYLNQALMKNRSLISLYSLVSTYASLGEIPPNYYQIIGITLSSLNEKLPGKLYSVWRAIKIIYELQRILEQKRKLPEKWLKKVEDNTNDILDLENKNGGFSWIKKDTSYIQPTYLALEIMEILKIRPKYDIKKHIRWLLKFKNIDGGFNGGGIKLPSDHISTFWALKSLLILSNFGKKYD